jgi:hypothetical protein
MNRKVPIEVYEELISIAGKVWLWERYLSEFGPLLCKQHEPTFKLSPVFRLSLIYHWISDEVSNFNAAAPDKEKIRLHDFRKRYVTEAFRKGIELDRVAIAVSMTSQNAKIYYNAVNEIDEADAVDDEIHPILGELLLTSDNSKHLSLQDS